MTAPALPPAEAPTHPHAPLGPIGLSLSGGGYRAAGFHLGVLGLLSDVGLLRSVAALSTVSGGTIVGMRWIVSLLDGQSFDDFRERFRAWLLSTNVVREALGRLASHPRGDVRSNPSLIRCAAAEYATHNFLLHTPGGVSSTRAGPSAVGRAGAWCRTELSVRAGI